MLEDDDLLPSAPYSESQEVSPVEDRAFFYECFPNDALGGEASSATPLITPDFEDIVTSAAQNPTIGYLPALGVHSPQRLHDKGRRSCKRRREPEQAFITNIKKFVKHGASPPAAFTTGQHHKDADLAIMADCAGRAEYGPSFAERLQKPGSDESAKMADILDGEAAADQHTSTAMLNEKLTHTASRAPLLPPCACTSPIALERIKEGMAQLLATYTWPWYKQNVQLFRALYNAQLVNDVTIVCHTDMLVTNDEESHQMMVQTED